MQRAVKGIVAPKTTPTINQACMRKQIFISVFAFLMVACSSNGSGNPKGDGQDTGNVAKDVSKKSLPAQTKKRVGGADVIITYHSPAVRGRVIWGGFVPYDAVWVTGAHRATKLEVGKNFGVGGRDVPAGKYALFSIPGKESWTIIINKNYNQHLTDNYDEKEDVVRFEVKPRATGQLVERLTYEIEQTGERTANVIISWEKLRVQFPMEIR